MMKREMTQYIYEFRRVFRCTILTVFLMNLKIIVRI